MKTRWIFIIGFMLAAMSAQAQGTGIKIGYTNADFILGNMPEAKQIESELKVHEQQLSTQLEAKSKDFQTKVAEYEKNAPNMIPEVRADKENELRNMQQSIQKFSQDAQSSLQRKSGELLQPVYDKIQKAIDAVAKANGYTHVFNSGQPDVGLNILLYARDEDNISDLVLKELGITPPPAEAAEGQ
ncbi:MAG: OmpH family outer membrane protein [Cyclobacteriaceae bacterium]|nr:OmpH family outer membrane protein [Cyclobacteriaceae bacterium]